MERIAFSILTALWVALAPKLLSAADSATSAAQQWAADHFDDAGPPETGSAIPATPGIEVIANHDPVQRNARQGQPLQINEQSFTRGLYCHAPSLLTVRLPAPGKRFIATVGIDSRETAGHGTVVATVLVKDQKKYRSPLLRGGLEGASVDVLLDGATEFQLQLEDGGDGIAYDQTDWADARVELVDGTIVWLGDLGESQPGLAPLGRQPFSFLFAGQPSANLLHKWRVERSSRPLDDGGVHRSISWTDPASLVTVRCEVTAYADFPVVDWTLSFQNGGKKDSPPIAHVQAMDLALRAAANADPIVLHHSTGTPVTPTDYQPHETPLAPDNAIRLRAPNGRPSNHLLPYFNVAWGSGATGLPPAPTGAGARSGGVIAVVGWPGNWAAAFHRTGPAAVRVTAGQGLTNFVLRPGEELRAPRSVLMFYDGDWIAGQNAWRRWMIAHNMPRPGGRLPAPALTPCSSHQFAEMINANEENQKLFIDRYLEEGLQNDYWWMDAGWYVQDKGWPQTGTWEVDAKRFPHGLRAIADYAHAKGVKTIVWFEPERVAPDTWLSNQHPEWIYGGAAGGLLKIGDAEVRRWLIDHVDRLITEQGIDLYRQDFNMDPLGYWRAADEPDRQGVAEIRHVEGYLAYWDELRRRHPDMLIDSCASGGCRNDLETMRRAAPLLRSDAIMDPVAQQNHTYGAALWLPFYGTGINGVDAYTFRSQMTPNLIGVWDLRNRDLDYAAIRTLLSQWRAVNANYYGDYFPLTPYAPGDDAWMAWQFHRLEPNAGMVQAFRRARASSPSQTVQLRGLDPSATYEVTNLDEDAPRVVAARELLETGLTITLDRAPASALISYRKVDDQGAGAAAPASPPDQTARLQQAGSSRRSR